MNPETSPEKAFRGSKHRSSPGVWRILGCLGDCPMLLPLLKKTSRVVVFLNLLDDDINPLSTHQTSPFCRKMLHCRERRDTLNGQKKIMLDLPRKCPAKKSIYFQGGQPFPICSMYGIYIYIPTFGSNLW